MTCLEYFPEFFRGCPRISFRWFPRIFRDCRFIRGRALAVWLVDFGIQLCSAAPKAHAFQSIEIIPFQILKNPLKILNTIRTLLTPTLQNPIKAFNFH